MSTTALKTAWADLPADFPMPLIARQRIIGEKMMISRVILSPGFTLPSHRHENEQFVVMLRGRCEFGLGEEGSPAHRTLEVRGGEVLHLPSNVPHSCRAIEETEILDLFSPVSAVTGVDSRRS
ncbi:MAG: cupin domain-containing protein [Planctomycetes bacterium]|nr:cupin domain-containing protein [Planctomycetota bacterium]